LRLGHLEQIDLRHRACDIEQGIDLTERRERLIRDLLCGRDFRKIDIHDERRSARCLDRCGGFIEIFPVARHKDDRGEVLGETDRGGPSDALAGAGDDGYRFGSDGFGHLNSPAACVCNEVVLAATVRI
jgi:hypothetical protein